MPHTLLKNGLVTALEEYVDFLNRAYHIRFVFVCGNSFQMDECKSVNIYRIIQEVIHNAIKHSSPSEISILK